MADDTTGTTTGDGTETALSRKDLLRRAGMGAGAVAFAAAAPAVPAFARGFAPALVRSRPTVALGYGGATCEAPLYAAYNKGLFAAEGLNVELVKLGNGYDTNDALSTGKLDGAPGILFTYLKPIEQGADIRLTAGLHGNCLRLVVAKNAGIKKATDFKGKTIATDSLGGSAMAFFSLLLAKGGIVVSFSNAQMISVSLPRLTRGCYLVMWFTVSLDEGQRAGGAFTFRVK